MLLGPGSAATLDRTTVIAEIAANHVGDIGLARRMIIEAAARGADLVSVSAYAEIGAEVETHSQAGHELLGRLALSETSQRSLAELAAEKGIGFTSSPIEVEHAEFLVEGLGLRAIKVESAEMLNLALLDYLNGKVRTVYLETGLAELEEIKLAVSRLASTPDVVIMHCVDQYPLADADANLSAIRTLTETFPTRSIGYSDHTIGLLAPLLAVALGATVIETHFTLDRSLPGTDHVLSVTPTELSELVHGLRHCEILLGRQVKGPGRDRSRLALVRPQPTP